MKILVTGATGYIGRRLIPSLVEHGHEVTVLVRQASRLGFPEALTERLTVVQGDLLDPAGISGIPSDLDAAYYLVHSMTAGENFEEQEARCAETFSQLMQVTSCKQLIYVSGMTSESPQSPHMRSRQRVEELLASSGIPTTVLRAGVVIGSGSASFEIIRDLCEKLPVMIAPKWLHKRIQPIGILDLLFYLEAVLLHPDCMGKVFDIGANDVLTYKEMLLRFAKVRGLKRWIISVPVLTPYLSSLWLALVTSTNFTLAKHLVESLRNEVTIRPSHDIRKVLDHKCMSYEEAVERAFSRIEENAVVSSWKDSLVSSGIDPKKAVYVEVPSQGCVFDTQEVTFDRPWEEVRQNVWSIGGKRGWYSWDWAWRLRGALDSLVGGVGLRRGRRHDYELKAGDSLDFWRVLLADHEHGHLVLFAEMRLPGEAWLEFEVKPEGRLIQKATFRPQGLLGRLYWYALFPVHYFVFRGMIRGIVTWRKKSA